MTKIEGMNSALSDRRYNVLINAFTDREPDERMERLYDEIINAKDTLCDSKISYDMYDFLTK
jgi:hypothetical protein